MNGAVKNKIKSWIPYVIGAILVAQFAALSAWQIGRGLEKRAEKLAFASQVDFTAWADGMDVRPFQNLQAVGHFVGEHQILLENIIINSRIGYYVLTPLRVSDDTPLLLVNRGWFERSATAIDPSSLALPATELVVRGRAGSLPRAGYRLGDSMTADDGWPRMAVYPTLEEIAQALDDDVQPFVLLMNPDDSYGFFRHWAPKELGPGQHFAYALQWFAMGIVLAGLLLWNYRKRGFES